MDVTALTAAERVEVLDQAFSAIDDVCSQIADDAVWDTVSDCPAWTVKDVLAHVASFEAVATGTPPASEVDVSHLSHPANEFDIVIEKEVEARRALPVSRILEEFRHATQERIRRLGRLDEAGWDGPVDLPFGPMPQGQVYPIRVLDVFYHEQDIRRAAGIPGHLDGAVAAFVRHRMTTQALPRIVGKLAAAPEGSTVVFDVDGTATSVTVKDGKGVLAGGSPTATLAMDLETFFCLLGGRWTPARAAGRLSVDGDAALAQRVLDHMAVTP